MDQIIDFVANFQPFISTISAPKPLMGGKHKGFAAHKTLRCANTLMFAAHKGLMGGKQG